MYFFYVLVIARLVLAILVVQVEIIYLMSVNVYFVFK